MLKAPISAHAPELIKIPVEGLDVDIEKVNTPTPIISANKAAISIDNSRIFPHNPRNWISLPTAAAGSSSSTNGSSY